MSKIYDIAIRLLSFRPRSEKELRDRLIEKKFDRAEIEATILRLKKEKLLDDEYFAKAWIRHRTIFGAKGRSFISRELAYKGVDKDLIQKTLEKEYNEKKEEKLAQDVAAKKLKTLHEKDRHKRYEKLVGFLSRRGFSWEIIKRVLNEIH